MDVLTLHDGMSVDVHALHEELEARGMGHVAELSRLAAERPHFRNEALEAPAPAAAPEPAAAPPAPSLVPAGDPAAPAPVAAPAEPVPAWAGELVGTVQDFGRFMELVNTELEADRQAAAAANAPAPPAPTPLPELNLYDPQSVAAYVEAVAKAQGSSVEERAQQLLDERIGPYQPILDAIAVREGETLAKAHLDELAGQIGDFDRDHALLLANSHMANGVNPAQAFLAAARMTQAFEARLRGGAVAENDAQLRNAVNAPAEPAPAIAPGAEVQKIDGRDPDRYTALADSWLNRRAAERRAPGLIG